jgi:hypothetical protein
MKLGTLNYNLRSEEGEIRWDKSVDLTKPDVVMLGILEDWLFILTNAYNDLGQITFPETEE